MEQFVDFLLFCLEVVFWYWLIGTAIRVWQLYRDSDRNEIQEYAEKISELMHKVQEEKHGDQYYWFDAKNDQFLAQGANVDDIVRQLKSRFPAHIFFVTSNNQHYYISDKTEWKFKPVDLAVE